MSPPAAAKSVTSFPVGTGAATSSWRNSRSCANPGTTGIVVVVDGEQGLARLQASDGARTRRLPAAAERRDGDQVTGRLIDQQTVQLTLDERGWPTRREAVGAEEPGVATADGHVPLAGGPTCSELQLPELALCQPGDDDALGEQDRLCLIQPPLGPRRPGASLDESRSASGTA